MYIVIKDIFLRQIDVEYPINLLNRHDDFSFLAEGKKIEKMQ